MPKTISVSKAKNELSAVLEWAVENQDEVVVESYGQPKAAILPYSAYASFLTMRENERRQAAIKRMKEIADTVQARNSDLNEEEANTIADDITRETIERMVKDGKVSFQEP